MQNTYNYESMVSALLLWQGAGIYSHLTLVVTDEGAAVCLDDVRELRGSELAVRHPARKLVVPHAVVATEQLAVRLREVGDLVTTRERELALGGFGCVLYVSFAIR